MLKNLKKLKKIIIEESSDESESNEDSVTDTPPKQKTRNEMKSQRNKKSIIKVHEPSTKQQTDFNHSLFFI